MAKRGEYKANAKARTKRERAYDATRKKARAERNRARAEAIKKGRVKKGDGKVVNHKKGIKKNGVSTARSGGTTIQSRRASDRQGARIRNK